MLIAKVTRRAGGFHLAGDFLDLVALHRSLHEMCDEDSDGDDHPENLVLQLAFDLRKCSEGRREKIKVEGFGDRRATYYAVTLSFVRASIQFGVLIKLVSGKSIPMKHTAAIHAFGAALTSALEQIEIASPEKFLAAVAQSVASWPGWPPPFIIDYIDRNYLYETLTRKTRVRRLKQLAECLQYGSPYATRALQARDEFAAEQGVDPESLGPAWPNKEPQY